MRFSRRSFIAVFLFSTILGFTVFAPAVFAAPTWVGVGKYATYHGVFDKEVYNPNLPGYARIRMTVDFNWKIDTLTATEAKINGSYVLKLQTEVTGSPGSSLSFSVSDVYEMIRLGDNVITARGGFDLFGMETPGSKTVLWIQSTAGTLPSFTSIAGRVCVQNYASMSILGFTGSVPVIRYYDNETGVLMGLNITISAMFGLAETWTLLSAMNSTNAFPWGTGGDALPIILAGAVGAAGTAIVVIVVLRKWKKKSLTQ